LGEFELEIRETRLQEGDGVSRCKMTAGKADPDFFRCWVDGLGVKRLSEGLAVSAVLAFLV